MPKAKVCQNCSARLGLEVTKSGSHPNYCRNCAGLGFAPETRIFKVDVRQVVTQTLFVEAENREEAKTKACQGETIDEDDFDVLDFVILRVRPATGK